ncbi:heavy metal-associated isoprenylated plant protein 7-like [Cicer arietinum]|uniref:Heavy metal-associated isoprenylated plant protein 7-like isoform X2 n=1 Tax=Cicer arietinum TaxID=3827 RepID=A0A1S2YA00_CICAR|nr:heavy metal-associated isoprenylated plant protein 7-like isoform X2 [Cicer arietinum]
MGEEEKKTEESKTEEKSKAEEKQEEGGGPPPPAAEIVLKVFMHCEACARKVRWSLKDFPGVEDVITDCKSHQVVVKGEKADPLKVLERVQKKNRRKVELLSPIPDTPQVEKPSQEVNPPEKEKKEEPLTVVLKVHMHCEACAHEIKKRIQRMKGVELAEADLKKSEVTVKGVYDPAMLVEYVYKRIGKHAVIMKEEKTVGEGAAKEEEGESKEKEKKEENIEEMKRMEYYFHNPSMDIMYAYPSANYYQTYPPPPPPQLFSDENPNACTLM